MEGKPLLIVVKFPSIVNSRYILRSTSLVLMLSFKELFSVKYGALAALVLQNTFLVVFMRYSRTVSGPLYASSTAVASMEVLKLITCLCVITYQTGGIGGLHKALSEELLQRPVELLKLSVPSLLYTVQNNLLYYALSHLDAATYSVCYQMKILTTAIFSVLLLQRKLNLLQWSSLVILTIGVALTQLSAQKNSAAHENTLGGFIAVIVAACLSGFAGVYFEKVLKSAPSSVWMRNIQMGCSSVVLGVAGVFLSDDRSIVLEHGFFYGYSAIVWTVIFLQAVGGLVVAVVVKYADNILKGFAASFSIITSCALCIIIFDFVPTTVFVIGACLVNVAMYLYSYTPPVPSEPSNTHDKSDGTIRPTNILQALSQKHAFERVDVLP